MKTKNKYQEWTRNGISYKHKNRNEIRANECV